LKLLEIISYTLVQRGHGEKPFFFYPIYFSRSSGDERLRKPYLPSNKQFLVTRSGKFGIFLLVSFPAVPSYRRAVDLLSETVQETVLEESDNGNENENWYTPSIHQKRNQDDDGVFVDPNETKSSPTSPAVTAKAPVAATDEYEDIENYEDPSLTLDAESAPQSGDEDDGVIHCRRYDVFICYDNYYRTPRVYLFGYDDSSAHHPLSPDRIMEDIIQDYINKTVTIEPHPHYAAGTPTASIHPCQHANAMKRILDEMMTSLPSEEHQATGEEKTSREATAPAQPTVNQYLFIFLKFLQSVIPTIEYDYTIDVQIQGRG
jgi:ubiquitin-like-conjugating enzyme ATG3